MIAEHSLEPSRLPTMAPQPQTKREAIVHALNYNPDLILLMRTFKKISPQEDLKCENFSRLFLDKIPLQNTNLRGAIFHNTRLRQAKLYGCDLRNADFRGADLRGASLKGADLRGADFTGACLRGTDLDTAVCTATDFSGCNLLKARNLTSASLFGARLSPEQQNELREKLSENLQLSWKHSKSKK
jgi:uncharacterized protein YjbI with pentapeptide repeats